MIGIAKEGQAGLVVSFSNGQIKQDIYSMALQSSNENIHNLEVRLANLELQLKGNTENQKWVDWLKIFGKTLDEKKNLTDKDKKAYLSGLLESIVVNYDAENKEHHLKLNFHLPVVSDGVIWNNPDNKKEGYKVKRGRKAMAVKIKKKDPRSKSSRLTPVRNHSVTVE